MGVFYIIREFSFKKLTHKLDYKEYLTSQYHVIHIDLGRLKQMILLN